MRTAILIIFIQLLIELSGHAQQYVNELDRKTQAVQYAALGLRAFEFGDHALMLSQYQKAIELVPTEQAYNWYAGVAAFKLGHYEQAISYNKKSLELDSSLANPYRNWGMALSAIGRYREALEKMDIAIRKKPTAFSYFQRAVIKDSLKDQKGALADYTTSIDLDSTNAEALIGRAALRVQMKKGSLNEVVDDLNNTIMLDSRQATAYYYRALALIQLGQFRQRVCKDLLLAGWLGLPFDQKFSDQYGTGVEFSMELVSTQRHGINPFSRQWSPGDLKIQQNKSLLFQDNIIRINLTEPVALKLHTLLSSTVEADKTITLFSISDITTGRKGKLQVISSRLLTEGVFLLKISYGEHPVEYMEYEVKAGY